MVVRVKDEVKALRTDLALMGLISTGCHYYHHHRDDHNKDGLPNTLRFQGVGTGGFGPACLFEGWWGNVGLVKDGSITEDLHLFILG